MIRDFKKSDMEKVLDIWLEASIKAHNFIEEDFWKSKLVDMRDVYLPSGETYVFEKDGLIKGFVSLGEDNLAALFVAPSSQGKGIGRQLMAKAKDVRNNLQLTVYKENNKSVEFYKKCGFKIIKEQVDEHTGHKEFLMGFND